LINVAYRQRNVVDADECVPILGTNSPDCGYQNEEDPQ
jgi:hypothetical protein